jgi:transcriptional regulator with XRE-family HTH domain
MKSDGNNRANNNHNELLLSLMGEVLTKYRKLRKMSQAQLAQLASVNRPYISDIERGLRNVSLLTFDSICAALDKPPPEMLQEVYVLYKIRDRRRRHAGRDNVSSAKER